MFERYTEKARRVIFFARWEASQFGSKTIETEHLLLGFLREDKSLTLTLFRSDVINAIRGEIERTVTGGKPIPTSVDLPLSNECRRVLAHATEMADSFGHKHVGTEHLLLGLLREEQSFAARLLRDRRVGLKQVRKLVSRSVGKGETPTQRTSESKVSIAEFGIDLTRQAWDGMLPRLVGREAELQRTVQVLCRHTRGNPVLVGEPGVGRKTIVYGLAKRIAEGAAPSLDGRRILSLDLAVIASGTQSRSRFEESLDSVLGELLYGGNSLILFIEGLHALSQSQRFLSLANVIKPGLLDGRVQCISTATPQEYVKTVESAPWLKQCFTVVEVKPATEVEAVEVLTGSKERFEKFHMVVYSEEAIRYAVFHASNYFPGRYLPEKAIDLMDEAGARAKIRQTALPDEVLQVRKRILSAEDRHERALKYHEFEKARAYADELKKERENLEEARKEYNVAESIGTVTREDIDQVVAERIGVSIELLRKSKAGASGQT